MKTPAEYIVGFLFTVSNMIFWYGGYTVFYIQYAILKYWPAMFAVGVSYGLGRFMS